MPGILARLDSEASSSRHGSHQVAKKWTSTTRPALLAQGVARTIKGCQCEVWLGVGRSGLQLPRRAQRLRGAWPGKATSTARRPSHPPRSQLNVMPRPAGALDQSIHARNCRFLTQAVKWTGQQGLRGVGVGLGGIETLRGCWMLGLGAWQWSGIGRVIARAAHAAAGPPGRPHALRARIRAFGRLCRRLARNSHRAVRFRGRLCECSRRKKAGYDAHSDDGTQNQCCFGRRHAEYLLVATL